MTQNDDLPVLVAPDLFQDPTLHIFNMMIYNLETKITILQPGTLLFSLHFSNISSPLAVPLSREKVVQKASMYKNIINYTFMDLLTRLISKVGHKNHHATQLEEYNDFVTPIGPGPPTKQLRKSACLANKRSQAKTKPILLAGTHPTNTDKAPYRNGKNFLADLTRSETDHALNSAFLLQSLMKKDFGLKITDIRRMQPHDRNLALDIAKLDTLT